MYISEDDSEMIRHYLEVYLVHERVFYDKSWQRYLSRLSYETKLQAFKF